MTFTGKVSNGAILIPPGVSLPEGLELQVHIPELPAQSTKVGERLLKFAGALEDMPPDLARNHDYYIHGAPRR
jgi:hypothetical protein